MKSVPSWLASGQGDIPLVLLHGMGSSAEVWLPQLHHFGRRRLTLAWTMPGYGNSPALAENSWEALADALAAMLDAQGMDRVHLLGHSIGGMVAQAFHHRHPQRVASLILSATSAGFGSPDPAWQEEFIRQRAEPLAGVARFADAAPALLKNFIGPAITPAMHAIALLAAGQVDRDRYLDYMRLLVTFDRKAALGDIAVPTLLLAGELDLQAPPKGMRRMAERIPHAALHEFPHTNHMANLESPDAFNRVVDDFLATHFPHTAP